MDDGSPDGTGELADALAAADPRVRVRHRRAKQGLGRAYLDGFAVALDGGAERIVQMDADFSHDPAVLPEPARPRSRPGAADLVIGSRYTAGGGVVDWGIGRRVISRGGSLFARIVLQPARQRPDRRVQGLAGADAREPSRSTASMPAATCSRSR